MTEGPFPNVKISPTYGPEKTDAGRLEDWVDVYQDRVEGWILAPAARLLEDDLHNVATFGILLSYFEPHGANILGLDSNGNSSRCFKTGFLDVFRVYSHFEREGNVEHHTRIEIPEGADPKNPKQVPRVLDERLDALYANARCGIYHTGMVRAGVFVQRHTSDCAVATEKATGHWFIDARKLTDEVRSHLNAYTHMLRDAGHGYWRKHFLSASQYREPSSWPASPRVLP